MKLTNFVLLATLLFPVSLIAQAPSGPTPNVAQQAIIKDANLIQAQMETIKERLHGIPDFQKYLEFENQLSQLSKQYNQAATPAPDVKPTVTAPTAKK